VLRLHYASIPEHDSDEWRAAEQSRINAGPKSPEWRTEYEVDPEARKGILIYPEWEDRGAHVGSVSPRTEDPWYLVAGIDYGTRAPTSILLGSWNGLWLRIWHEHYFARRQSAWHKAQLAAYLAGRLGLAADDPWIFSIIRYTFVDPTAMLDLEYASEPQPWVHLGTIAGKRLNDVKSGEDAVHSFLQRRGACCNAVLYEQSPIQDDRGRRYARCPRCGDLARVRVGLRVDRSCYYLRHQMRTLRTPKPREGEEVDEKKKPKQPDHSTDGCRYLCHGLSTLMDPSVIKKPKKVEIERGTRYHLPKRKAPKTPAARAYG
jgi:hypothetical protein